jgi:hypothetical protein
LFTVRSFGRFILTDEGAGTILKQDVDPEYIIAERYARADVGIKLPQWLSGIQYRGLYNTFRQLKIQAEKRRRSQIFSPVETNK